MSFSLVARLARADRLGQGVIVGELLAVDRLNDIALLQAGLRGGAVLGDLRQPSAALRAVLALDAHIDVAAAAERPPAASAGAIFDASRRLRASRCRG